MNKPIENPESLTDLPSLPTSNTLEGLQNNDFSKEQSYGQAIEQGNSSGAMPQPQQQASTAVSATANPIPQPSDPVAQAGLPLPVIADDNDLIEKEWVVKAKQIVEHTKHDPHLQNTEMSKIKADYLKKRYNKELKASS